MPAASWVYELNGRGGGGSGGSTSFVSVTDYGAVGDGVADDTPAFQAAIDANTDGVAIYVPTGTYKTTAPINLANNDTRFFGDGTSSVITRSGSLPAGKGMFDVHALRVKFEDLMVDPGVTTPTRLNYSAFSDPEDPQLSTNTTFWFHSGSGQITLRQVTVQHTGGYAIELDARTGDIRDVVIEECRFLNNRPHLFGTDNADLNYGSWTGGIHAQGDGVSHSVINLTVSNCTFRRCTGNCVWTHVYAFSKFHSNVRVVNCHFEDVGLDCVMMGGVDNAVVDSCTGRRVGYICTDDASASVPRWCGGKNATAIDSAGYVRGGVYSNNSLMSVNGGFIDGDGFGQGLIEGNTCIMPQSGEVEYAEDSIATCGPGNAGSNSYGINISNTMNQPVACSAVSVVGNTMINITGGAIRLWATRNSFAIGNTIHHPAAPLNPPIQMGPIGSGPYQRSNGNVVSDNQIWWNPAIPRASIVEEVAGLLRDTEKAGALILALPGPQDFVPSDKNWVAGNKLLGVNSYEFERDPNSSSTTRVTLSSNAALLTDRSETRMMRENNLTRWYVAIGGSETLVMTMQDAGTYGTAPAKPGPLFNVAGDTYFNGTITTGNRTTSAFDDAMLTGKLYADCLLALTDATYGDAQANILPDTTALLRFKKTVGYIEQSLTTSSGARVWIPLSGGTVAPPDKAIQYNKAGAFAGEAGFNWDYTTKALNLIPGVINVYSPNGNQVNLTLASDTSYFYPYISFNRHRGTLAAPTQIAGGDILGGVNWYGSGMGGAAILATAVSVASGTNYVTGALSLLVSDGSSGGVNATALQLRSAYAQFYENVGVGMVPFTALSLYGHMSAYSLITTSVSSPVGASIYLGDANFPTPNYYNSAPGLSAVWHPTPGVASDLAFYTYNGSMNARAERMRIVWGGFVGINTPSPAYQLHVKAAAATNAAIFADTGYVLSDAGFNTPSTNYQAIQAPQGGVYCAGVGIITTAAGAGGYIDIPPNTLTNTAICLPPASFGANHVLLWAAAALGTNTTVTAYTLNCNAGIRSQASFISANAGVAAFQTDAGGATLGMGLYLKGHATGDVAGGLGNAPASYGGLAYKSGSTYYYWDAAGAGAWKSLDLNTVAGATAGGVDQSVQYKNAAGVFTGDGNLKWDYTQQILNITGKANQQGLYVANAYVEAQGGFNTSNTANTAIQAPGGGMWAAQYVATGGTLRSDTAYYYAYQGVNPRWFWGKTGTAEYAGDGGSDFIVGRYANDNSYLGYTFFIRRDFGYVCIGGNVPLAMLQVTGKVAGFPTAGDPTNVAMIVSNQDRNYGVVMGAHGSGVGWIQSMRVDASATVYTLSLQPAGGSIQLGDGVSTGYTLNCQKYAVTNAGGVQCILGAGLTWTDSSWLIYHLGSGDNNLYIRDQAHGLMSMAFGPGSGTTPGNTIVYGRLAVNNAALDYQLNAAGDCNITGVYRINGVPIGGVPGGVDQSIQYKNAAGGMTGDGNFKWDYTNQILNITGKPGQQGLYVGGGYVLSDQGFNTTSTSDNAIQAPSGGVKCKKFNQAASLTSFTDAVAASAYFNTTMTGASGSVYIPYWFDNYVTNTTLTSSVYGTFFQTVLTGTTSTVFLFNVISRPYLQNSGTVNTMAAYVADPYIYTAGATGSVTFVMGFVSHYGAYGGGATTAITNYVGFMARNPTAPSQNSYGFFAESQSNGTVNNFGIYLNQSATPTGAYSIFSGGAAPSFFNGKIGVTVNPSYPLHVKSTAGTVAIYADTGYVYSDGGFNTPSTSYQSIQTPTGGVFCAGLGITNTSTGTIGGYIDLVPLNVGYPAGVGSSTLATTDVLLWAAGSNTTATPNTAKSLCTNAGIRAAAGIISSDGTMGAFTATAGGYTSFLGIQIHTNTTGGLAALPGSYGGLSYQGGSTYLYWNGSAWAAVNLATTGGAPGGSTTQVQFNNAGAFAGSANYTWNDASRLLNVNGSSNAVAALSVTNGFIQSNGGLYVDVSTSYASIQTTGGIVSAGRISQYPNLGTDYSTPSSIQGVSYHGIVANANGLVVVDGVDTGSSPNTVCGFIGRRGISNNGSVTGPYLGVASVKDLTSGLTIMSIGGRGTTTGTGAGTSNGWTTAATAAINFKTSEAWGAANWGSEIVFAVTPNGQTTRYDKMWVRNNGGLEVQGQTTGTTLANAQSIGVLLSNGNFRAADANGGAAYMMTAASTSANLASPGFGVGGLAYNTSATYWYYNGSVWSTINFAGVITSAAGGTGVTVAGTNAITISIGQAVGTSNSVSFASVQASASGASIAFQTSSPFNFQVDGNGNVSCQQLNIAGTKCVGSDRVWVQSVQTNNHVYGGDFGINGLYTGASFNGNAPFTISTSAGNLTVRLVGGILCT